jgi:RNA polymerase sigma-70 factor (ECF subfamily)
MIESGQCRESDSVADQVERPIDVTEQADVQKSLEGDGDAFRRIVHRYQQHIGDYMWRFTRDGNQCEELVHEVFVEAYFSLSSYAARAPFLHWLKRIATRVGYRCWKQRQRHREVSLGEEALAELAATTDANSAREAGELVQQLLSRLAPRDRLVMTLMYLESCGMAEIAELTGWSHSMVKVQAHRARKRLRKICDTMGIEL